MELLLNPNVAYLLLMAGFLMAVLALLSPGTGILEIGAVFAWLLAGWSVYNLPVNYWALGLLFLSVIPFGMALRTPHRRLFLVLAVGGLLVGSAFLFRGEGWQPAVNPVLAGLVSVLSVGYFWLIVFKTIEARSKLPSHDLALLIGAAGEAKSDIHTEGSVQVLGELWTARSELFIPAGSAIRVVGRDGFVLEVEAKEH